MIARSALSDRKKNTDNTQYGGFSIGDKKSLLQTNRIEFISIHKKNKFDSKVSFVNTIIRALKNERNINNRSVILLYDTYCLLCSVIGLCD